MVEHRKLLEALSALKYEQPTATLERFRADPKTYYAVCYLFVIAIESLTDIAQYLVADRGRRAESQRDVFTLLARESILPTELAERLGNMYGFRNYLIHAYPQMDDAKVAKYLTENLGDFDAFLSAVDQAMRG